MIHPGFPHLTAETKRFIDERLERGEGMTRIRLMMLVSAHMHYAGNGEAENAEAIEYELEQCNYHELLEVLRNHNYGHAIDWIKERYA